MADTITKWSESFITNNGLALRQKAIALGLEVVFTYGQIGEGVPTDLSQIPLMTSLVQFSHQVQLARSLSIGPTHHVDVKIDNMNFPASVLMRELAIFAKIKEPEDPIDDPELEAFFVPTLYEYAYTITGYESVPAGADFHRIWSVGIDTQISRSASISILYDGSFTYVTYADLEAVSQTATEAMLLAQSFAGHISASIVSDAGVHAIRYFGGYLQVNVSGQWMTIGGTGEGGDVAFLGAAYLGMAYMTGDGGEEPINIPVSGVSLSLTEASLNT